MPNTFTPEIPDTVRTPEIPGPTQSPDPVPKEQGTPPQEGHPCPVTHLPYPGDSGKNPLSPNGESP